MESNEKKKVGRPKKQIVDTISITPIEQLTYPREYHYVTSEKTIDFERIIRENFIEEKSNVVLVTNKLFKTAVILVRKKWLDSFMFEDHKILAGGILNPNWGKNIAKECNDTDCDYVSGNCDECDAKPKFKNSIWNHETSAGVYKKIVIGYEINGDKANIAKTIKELNGACNYKRKNKVKIQGWI